MSDEPHLAPNPDCKVLHEMNDWVSALSNLKSRSICGKLGGFAEYRCEHMCKTLVAMHQPLHDVDWLALLQCVT